MTDIRFFGWDFEQWAIAAARVGWPEDVTPESLLKMKAAWAGKGWENPGEVRFIGVEPEKDFSKYDEFCEAVRSVLCEF